MAWKNAFILTIADSVALLSMLSCSIFFILHLKPHAAILWACILTIFSYVLSMVHNLTFHTDTITHIPNSWLLANAFAMTFDCLAFQLVVMAIFKVYAPSMPASCVNRKHIIPKMLWGFLWIPAISTAVMYFVYAIKVTANASRRRLPYLITVGAFNVLSTTSDVLVDADRVAYAIMALRGLQTLAVVLLLIFYLCTIWSCNAAALNRKERLCLAYAIIPGILFGTLVSTSRAAIVVWLNIHSGTYKWYNTYFYTEYCVVAVCVIVVYGGLANVVREWLKVNRIKEEIEPKVRISSIISTTSKEEPRLDVNMPNSVRLSGVDWIARDSDSRV